jgi:hypothetical protein
VVTTIEIGGFLRRKFQMTAVHSFQSAQGPDVLTHEQDLLLTEWHLWFYTEILNESLIKT